MSGPLITPAPIGGPEEFAQPTTVSRQTRDEHCGGPFACPDCQIALSLEQGLQCLRCGRSYLASDGTACFNDRGLYHGPILPKAEMVEVMALAEDKGYRYVLTKDLWERDPDFARYITEPARTGGLQLLQLAGDERVLDFGCAFGVFSLELARRVSLVVALDVTLEKVQFLSIVKRQAGLPTLFPVCNGDPLRLPFPDDFFDWVILNAVFEYLPLSIEVADVEHAHLLALREIRRILKPGGRIYLATKNRYSYLALLGDKDHDGLRFTSVLPRSLSNRISLRCTGVAYRTITHSYRGYCRLFHAANLRLRACYWPLPSLQYPERFVPLTGPRAQTIAAVGQAKSAPTPAGVFWRTVAHTALLRNLAPHYVIVAEKLNDGAEHA